MHDLSLSVLTNLIIMTVQNLNDFFIVTVGGIDYRCYIVGVNKNNAINLLNNSTLGDKGVL